MEYKKNNLKTAIVALTFIITIIGVASLFYHTKPIEKPVVHISAVDTVPSFYHTSDFMVDTVGIVSIRDLKGSSLYKINCKICHGDNGTGDGVKSRLQNGICPHDLSKENKPDDIIYYIILNGGDRMPSSQNKLSNNDAKILVVYIKKFKRN